WVDAAVGGNQLASGTTSFIPSEAGTYYAETKKLDANCEVSSRTAVTLTIDEKPEVFDENLQVCPDVPLTLDAGAGNYTYQWASGETGRNLVITEPGNYSVVLTNTQGRSE